jgi:hypothetical protein
MKMMCCVQCNNVDEDLAMKIAIHRVFEKTHHQYCRFHVTHTWRHELDSVTSLHRFMEKMLEALKHMDHMDAEESHCSQDVIGYLLLVFLNAAVFTCIYIMFVISGAIELIC